MPEDGQNHEHVEDTQLVRRAQDGDRSAFDELVIRYRRKVYSIAYGMTRNHQDADDLAQETFLRAWQGLDSFKTEHDFHPWLFRITANLSINVLKRKSRRTETSVEDIPGFDIPESAPSSNPGHDVEQLELKHRICKAVNALSPKLKAVFHLRTMEEMSYQEIADTLNISTGTVMSRLNRARERLRRSLSDVVLSHNDEAR